MQVVATRAQPTLEVEVRAPDQSPRLMTVFTGTVDVVPPDSGQRFRVIASNPDGVPVAFPIAGAQPLPVAGAVLVAEAWVARLPISTGAEDTLRYGITDVQARLVPSDADPQVGLPFLEGLLFGGDLTMTLAYRLTVLSPVPR